MLIIDRSVITDGGAALLNSGDPINITSVKTGSGTYTSSEDIKSRTALKSTQYSYTPSSVTVDGATRSIDALLSNYDPVTEQAIVTSDYTLTEVGLFATVNGADVLFAIAVSYNGTVVPAYTGQNKSEIIVSWDMALSGTDNITVTAAGAVALATDLEAHVEKQAMSVDGAHGIRFYNETLSAYNPTTEEWEEIKTGGGGSLITITAGSSSLIGQDIVLSDGVTSLTQVMPSDGVCVFEGVTMTGNLLASCDLTSILAEVSIDAPYYGSYEAELNVGDTFTLLISTTESTLIGKTVTVSGTNYTKSATMPAGGTLNMKVTYVGELTITATDGTSTATRKVTTEAGTWTYNVALKFTTGIYGASWDGTSTTAWTRTDDAEEYVDPVPYVAGATNYGSPFDDNLPWSGMVKSTRNGNVVVAIPKFWYKITQEGAGMTIKISDHAETGFSVSPAHMNRGDGKGERDVVYVGRYHCNSSYKSAAGSTPVANITRSAARASIHNTGSTIWQMDFATRFTLWLLYIVEFADWNSQAKIGYGCGNNSGTENMGYTDSMPYHTGTTQASRTTYGLGTQYRNIEGLWDNVYDWLDGCYYDANGLNIIKNPSSFSDSSGGTAVGVPSSGYPSAFSVKNVSGTYTLFIPTAASGSDSTYSCDYWSFSASNPCLFAGGYYGQRQSHGLFFVSYDAATGAHANRGCRLLELP
jgi:hypothetical protein